MEYSPLDLLASTALRENNTLQQQNQDPQHKDSNNSQENDDGGDDDETDGKTDSSTTVKENSTLEDGMGSVKCGTKHKKTASKTMVKSIYVRDGKCVAKEVSAAVVIPGKNGNHHSLAGLANVALIDSVSVKDKLEVDVCSNNNALPRSIELCPDMQKEVNDDTYMCNGTENNVDSKMVPGTGLSNGDHIDVAVDRQGELNFFVAPATTDPADMTCEAETPLGNDVLLDKLPTSAALAAAASGALEVAKVSQRNVDTNVVDSALSGSNTGHVTERDVQQPQQPQSCGGGDTGQSHVTSADSTQQAGRSQNGGTLLSTQTLLSEQGSDKTAKSSETTNTSTDLSNCKNCDENRSVEKSSSSSSSSLSQSSSGIVGKDSVASIVDQTSNNSGSRTTNPTSCELFSMLSSPAPRAPLPIDFIINAVHLDHSYYSMAARPSSRPNVDNADDSGDAFESADENACGEDIERRPRSLSVDSVYLQNGGATTNPSPLENAGQTDRLALLSPAPSMDSASNDSTLSEQSNVATGGHFYSILTGGPNSTRLATAYPKSSLLPEDATYAPPGSDRSRVGASLLTGGGLAAAAAAAANSRKFQIGNFGSFSNTFLDLESDNKNKLKIGIPTEPVMKHSMSSPALASPGSPFPMLQSPAMEWDRSDAGSEVLDDADSSTTEDKFLSSSLDSDSMSITFSQVWHHPVFHDHDYFCKEVSEKLGKPKPPPVQVKNNRRKQTKKKDRQMAEDKGKYLKMELLKQDNRFNLSSNASRMEHKAFLSRAPVLADLQSSKPNPVGRPRKRSEKTIDECDSETGTKMKITGQYQDQYVYYYSKTSRSRRRKFDEKMPSGDRILIPTPKPGDIVVPHLTDADCDAIKRGGRSAFAGGASSNQSAFPLQSSAVDQLMDSSIVNTILSLENDSPWAARPPQTSDGELDGLTSRLTTEQVDLLIDCLKQYDDPEDLNSFLTTASTTPMASTTVDSMAATTVEELAMSGMSTVTTTSSLPTVSTTATQSISSAGMVDVKAETSVASSVSQAMAGHNMPIVPSPCTSPSVEKNLEFLTNDFYPGPSVPPTSVSENLNFCHLVPDTGTDFIDTVESAVDVTTDDNETPWIVTLTLYYNDIPAIIINNTPYVRLVDIHKQILPAKDTGILKKRCQLMKIPVINCSEMQRYFLVQYGRAQNSKSTLVITKDEAYRLISYYAQPQPRNLRSEEPSTSSLRRSSSLADVRPYGESRSATSSPTPAFAQPRKRGGFRRRGVAARSHNPSPEPVVSLVTPQGVEQPPPPSPLPAEPASPSKRLRHKKINFRELLKGEDGSSSQASSPLVEGGYIGDEASNETLTGRVSAAGHKHSGTKDHNSVVPAKRRRKDRLKSAEAKKEVVGVSPDASSEVEISVDEVSPTMPTPAAKSRKRSPGTSAPVSTPARSHKSKFGPIRVNVRSLVHKGPAVKGRQRKKNLFGRKNNSCEGVDVVSPDHPLRVLSISHQDAGATVGSTTDAQSPAADIYLHMYDKASSRCILCQICKTYLSVGDFLKHLHLVNSENLMEVPQQRKPVPLSKNMSDEEKNLWKEFVVLHSKYHQSVPGGSAFPPYPYRQAEEMYSSSPPALVVRHKGKVGKPLAVANEESSVEVIDCTSPQPGDVAGSDAVVVDNVDAGDEAQVVATTSRPLQPMSLEPLFHSSPIHVPSTHTQNEEKIVNSVTAPTPVLRPQQQQQQQRHRKLSSSPSNVRTSSRQRKNKRFFGCENYEFTAGSKKNANTSENDGQNEEGGVDVDGDSSLNSSVHHLSSGSITHASESG